MNFWFLCYTFECVHFLKLQYKPNPNGESKLSKVVDVVPVFHKLVDRISRDSEWLNDTLEKVVSGDPFTAELLKESLILIECIYIYIRYNFAVCRAVPPFPWVLTRLWMYALF